MLRLIEVRATLADLEYRSGRRDQAAHDLLNLIPVAHRLSVVADCTLNCRTQEAEIENQLTYELLSFNPSQAVEHAVRGIALLRNLVAKYPAESTLKDQLGSLMAGAGGAYRSLGELEKAGDYYRQSIEAREALMRIDPNDSALRRNLLIVYGNYSQLLGIPWSPNLGRPEEARECAAKGVALAREMVAADPNDATAKHDLGMILGRFGMIDPDPDGVAQSLRSLDEARSLIELIASANAKSPETANQLAMIMETQGLRQEALGRLDEAAANYHQGMALLRPFFDLKNSTATVESISLEKRLAELDAAKGDSVVALKLSEEALSQTKTYVGDAPLSDAHLAALASAWSSLAKVQAKLNRGDQARESAATASKLWQSIKQAGILTAHRPELADVRSILAGSN